MSRYSRIVGADEVQRGIRCATSNRLDRLFATRPPQVHMRSVARFRARILLSLRTPRAAITSRVSDRVGGPLCAQSKEVRGEGRKRKAQHAMQQRQHPPSANALIALSRAMDDEPRLCRKRELSRRIEKKLKRSCTEMRKSKNVGGKKEDKRQRRAFERQQICCSLLHQ